MNETLRKYKKYAENFEYMSDVKRNRERIIKGGEIFTQTETVLRMLDMLEQKEPILFSDPTRTFLDDSCGDGQMLIEVVIRKMERSNCSLEQALRTTYGTELMEDNVKLCRKRLAGPNPTKEILDIVEHNIVCTDMFKWDYENWRPKNYLVTEFFDF